MMESLLLWINVMNIKIKLKKLLLKAYANLKDLVEDLNDYSY